MGFEVVLEEEISRLRQRLLKEHALEIRLQRQGLADGGHCQRPPGTRRSVEIVVPRSVDEVAIEPSPRGASEAVVPQSPRSVEAVVPGTEAGLVELEKQLSLLVSDKEDAVVDDVIDTPPFPVGNRRYSAPAQQEQQAVSGFMRPQLKEQAMTSDHIGALLDEAEGVRSNRRHRTLMSDEQGTDLNGRRLSANQMAAEAAVADVERRYPKGQGSLNSNDSAGEYVEQTPVPETQNVLELEAKSEHGNRTPLEKMFTIGSPESLDGLLDGGVRSSQGSKTEGARRASFRRHSLRRASTHQNQVMLMNMGPIDSNGDPISAFQALPIWMFGRGGNPKQSKKSHGTTFKDLESFDGTPDQEVYSYVETLMRDFMLNPNSVFFLAWNLVGLLLIGYDCVVIPLEVFEPDFNSFMQSMEWIVRLFWTVNVVLSFFTGYMRTDGALELRPKKVARHYIMTWMGVDFFVVGFDWLEMLAQGSEDETADWNRYGAALRGMRMIRTVRLIRIIRAPQITKTLTEYVSFGEQVSLVGTIAKIMLFFLWMTHICACMWYGLSHLLISGVNRWVVKYTHPGQTVAERYTISLRWSLLTFSGDDATIEPQNLTERVFAMIILYIAFVVSASYVGSITTSMTRFQFIVSEQSLKISELRRFLQDYGISRHLAVRVQRNAQHAMMEEKTKAPEERVELLKVLSQPVLIEVHFEIHSKVLMMHPFFLLYNDVNPAGIRKVCHMAVSTLSLHTGDVLFSEMEVPGVPRMFFIVSGALIYMQDKKETKLQEGTCLSEGTLWTLWTHMGTARSTTETRITVLEAEGFQDIVSSFPTDHAGNYAGAFCKRLNDLTQDRISDMPAPMDEVYDMISQAFPIMEDDELDGNGEPMRSSSVIKRGDSSAAVEATDSWKSDFGGWLGGVTRTHSDRSDVGPSKSSRRRSHEGGAHSSARMKVLVMELERRQLARDEDSWKISQGYRGFGFYCRLLHRSCSRLRRRLAELFSRNGARDAAAVRVLSAQRRAEEARGAPVVPAPKD